MGDRIVINFTDGKGSYSPDFYGHWCGLRGLHVANQAFKGRNNGIQSIFANFVVMVMEGQPQQYSYYVYNHGEANGAADWDNYEWTLDVSTGLWTTTHPNFAGCTLTTDEVEEFVKENRSDYYDWGNGIVSESKKGRSIFRRGKH